MPKNSFSKIFGDIEPLFTLNLTFQEELLKEENVGTAFLKIAPYLKIYATYAHDYELAITSLQVGAFLTCYYFMNLTKFFNI